MRRRGNFHIHNARCPEIFYVSAGLSENLFFGIFHPCAHTYAHTPHFIPQEGGGWRQLCQDCCTCDGREQRCYWKQALTLRLPWKRGDNSSNVLPCIEYIWVIHANRAFEVSVWFYYRKIHFFFCKVSFPILSVKSWKRFIADNCQITMWYLFFSKVMLYHRHCSKQRGCLRCKTFCTHQPHCRAIVSEKKNLPVFLWTHSRRTAFALGQCQA